MMPRAALLGLVLSLFPASRASADVAATGSFDVSLTPAPPSNVTFDGDITFDPGPRTFLGATVDMSTAVGDMTFEGDGTVDVANESAAFTLTAESEGDFDFAAAGTASCEKAGCLAGKGNFGGRLTAINGGVLPAGVFTFDGTIAINAVGEGLNGVFAINAFAPVATSTGTDVVVTSGPTAFYDTVADEERSFTATARFTSVTAAGNTEFVAFSTFPSEFPSGIAVNRNVSVFVDIRTTAAVTGQVQVCLAYPDANDDDIVDGTPNNLNASRLRLLHAADVDSSFADRTVSFGSGQVCGNVPAVGPVALGVGSGGTTTTVVGASTTTTSLEPGATTTTSSTVVGETSTTSTTVVGETTTTTLGGETTTTTVIGETTTTSTSLPGQSTTTLPSGASTTTSTTPAGGGSTTTTLPSGGSTTTTISTGGPTTTSTTLPACVTAIDCLDLAIAGPLCPGETIDSKLSTLILKKLTKAQKALLAARTTGSGKKLARLVIKARKQMDKVGKKADAFVSKRKGAISVACRDQIRGALILVTQQIAASRI
jgi:hypothetical protein